MNSLEILRSAYASSLLLISILIFLSCSTKNPDLIKKLENFNELASHELDQHRDGFNNLVDESFYDESETVKKVSKIYNMLASLIPVINEATSSNDVSEQLKQWNKAFGTELTLAKSNDLKVQKLLTILDIQLNAKELVDETAGNVGAGPIKFDILKFYLTADKAEIKLGESTEIGLTFAAVPGDIDLAFDILLNGDTVETKDGQGTYQFKPTQRGTFEFNGSIQAKPGMKMLEGWKMEDRINIVVK